MRIDWPSSRQHQSEPPSTGRRQGEGSTEPWPWLCEDRYLLQEKVEQSLLPGPSADLQPLVRTQIQLFHALVGAAPLGAGPGHAARGGHPALAILPAALPFPAAELLAGVLPPASQGPAPELAEDSRSAGRRPNTPLEVYHQLYGAPEVRRCA